MTKAKRVTDILKGIVMILFSFEMILYPMYGLAIVAAVVGIGLSLQGISALLYYALMARSMVGGKMVLYRGIFLLDLGIFTSTLAGGQNITIILYIAVVNAFAGLVSILRAAESKRIGSQQWIYYAAYGLFLSVMAAAVLISVFLFEKTEPAVFVYAAGLFYSAVRKIKRAFQRTAIVYIP